MGKVNEHSAWGGSAYNSGFGVARSPPERGGVLGAVDCTAFYFKYHLHLHAVPVEGRGADSLSTMFYRPLHMLGILVSGVSQTSNLFTWVLDHRF